MKPSNTCNIVVSLSNFPFEVKGQLQASAKDQGNVYQTLESSLPDMMVSELCEVLNILFSSKVSHQVVHGFSMHANLVNTGKANVKCVSSAGALSSENIL